MSYVVFHLFLEVDGTISIQFAAQAEVCSVIVIGFVLVESGVPVVGDFEFRVNLRFEGAAKSPIPFIIPSKLSLAASPC